uniref:Uncharacterized protein n=1 Tax=Amphimedon queenslandica TaxID=400682 RepID=A0A1X7U255_AMPQE
MYYYAFLFCHPKEGYSPVAIGEFFIQEHTVLAIANFLESLRHYEYILYGSKLLIHFHKFVIDSSITLLISMTKVIF